MRRSTRHATTIRFVLVGGFALAIAACAQPDGIAIEGAYVRNPTPPRKVAVGYFVAENRGTTMRRLVAARTPAAERVEIHTHAHEGDMMRMRRVDAVDLPPDETVELAPGGLHLMLFGVTRFDSDAIEIVLVFDDGSEQRTRFEVRRAT